ncbi:MAG: hypothetical protein NC394_03890 [Bacteroides sp.]|nr:hypothetical protein [Bacteroides sp.]
MKGPISLTVEELCAADGFKTICAGESGRTVKAVYCGDLLSRVMLKAPDGCAWVTVMGNVNAAAVAYAANVSCIILAEGAEADSEMLERSAEHGINVLGTELPVFEAAMAIYEKLNE